jgi:hypothetical protein
MHFRSAETIICMFFTIACHSLALGSVMDALTGGAVDNCHIGDDGGHICEKEAGAIGVSEMLLSTCICGVAYAVRSPQCSVADGGSNAHV